MISWLMEFWWLALALWVGVCLVAYALCVVADEPSPVVEPDPLAELDALTWGFPR